MTSSFLSTGKRKKVASRVFGESVFNEADASLCYTPSPGPSIGKAALSARSGITRVEEDCETESPEPIILFHSTEQVHARTLSTSEKQVSFASQKENSSNYCESSIKTKSTLHCPVRKNELNRLRAAKKSPIRSTLVRLTEVAIDKATTSLARTLPTRPASVNEGLNAIRKSKKTILQDKSKATKSVRFKWDQEISQSTFLRDKVEQSQRSIRAIQRQISSAHFRQKAQRDESKKMQLFAELEKEYIFNSEVFRDHKETLKQERDKSRKMSVETREKIRLNNRAGEEKLKMLKLEEERAAFEVRADLHKARVEAAKASAEARRKSFQFRAGDARKIKDMRSKWRDIQLQHDHESYELTRAAAKDVDNHKKQVAEEERDDVRSRNLEARHRRKIEEELSHQAMLAEHESYELKWAGERDAHSYQTKMKEERRKSLASRNKESARHAKVMEELRTLSKEQQAESFILKWAGEDDVKAYKAQLAQNRKKSLQNRAMESRKWRQYEEEEHALNVQKALEEGGIQSACQKDVEKYKADSEERRRKSFQFRGKLSQVQRLEEEQRRVEKKKKDEEGFKLETMARKDVEEYYKDCQRRRRKSLAMRAKEMRQHVEWKRRKAEQELDERAHTSHLQSLDIHHMALAREKERARKAMDALRKAGCTVKGNPFGDLLDDV